MDNTGNPNIAAARVWAEWRYASATAPKNAKTAFKFRVVQDGPIEVGYDLGKGERTATFVIDCKAQLGLPNTRVETGCATNSGFATFVLENPTRQSVTFTLETIGIPKKGTSERVTQTFTVPAGQNRSANLLNMSDGEYTLNVMTPNDPTNGFFGSRVSNYLNRAQMTCSAANPRVVAAQSNHLVTTSCSGSTGVVQVHTKDEAMRATIRMGNYSASNVATRSNSDTTVLSNVKSGVYDIYVGIGTTFATFADRIVDCDAANYGGGGGGGGGGGQRPEQVRAELKSSCLSENGRIDAFVYNNSSSARTFYLDFPRLARRSTTVPAGGEGRMTITGRRDGSYTTKVSDDTGQQLVSSQLTVACDPPLVPARVKQSCLAGNGRVDVYVGNTTNSSDNYEVKVGTIVRTVRVEAGDTSRVAVTGRRDGKLGVGVTKAGSQIHYEIVDIACD